MRIDRHPDVSTLLTCAAGSQPEALCAVVASHISVCPTCLKTLREMQGVGEVLFNSITPAFLRHPPPAMPANTPPLKVLEQPREAEHASEVPRTLRHVLGVSLDALSWSTVGRGIEQHVIALSPGAKGDLRVLRLDRGACIPEHGHQGEELSLVLRGACRDAEGTYLTGDFMDMDDDARHGLIADDQAGCILIVGSERPLEFLTTSR
jgi:putative transcriptional regulator